MLYVSSEVELSMVREENAPLVVAVNEYRVLVKNLEKMQGKERLDGIELLQDLERSEERSVTASVGQLATTTDD